MALQSTTAIATITLQQASSTVTFSGIPNTYRDLVLVFSGTGSTNAGYIVNFNNTSTGYTRVGMYGDSSGAFSFSESNAAWLEVGTTQSVTTLQVLDYNTTDKHKTILSRTNVAGTFTMALAGRWASLDSIDMLSLYRSGQTFQAGSTFSLYGRIA